MKIKFYKYQGTGNDFVMIDNRTSLFPKENMKLIKHLCDRRFGIGADGLILLEKDTIESRLKKSSHFKMVYFNSDGNQSSMCGNGGRCLVAFAKSLSIIDDKATFVAIDGLHHATIDENNIVSLQMNNVLDIKVTNEYIYLDTGSPHHVQIVENLSQYNVKENGSRIRNSDLYGQTGCNVNFVTQISEIEFSVRTYERGVEDETLSCGTGTTAVAIAMHAIKKTNATKIHINVRGGKLIVFFEEEFGDYLNVFLKGSATFVFSGEIESEIL